MLKEKLLTCIQQMLSDKINSLKTANLSLKESQQNETKSSVGDKYETAREMVQQELNKNRTQLARFQKLKIELSKIDTKGETDYVKFGSLVVTTQNSYFISAAVGKIELEKQAIMCISLASPIGKRLQRKEVGDKIFFQGMEIEIIQII